MKINILAFGIAKEIVKGAAIDMEMQEEASVFDLRKRLESDFPDIKSLATYMIAINNNYADNRVVIHAGDEVAIIPPVSGG